MCIIPLGVDEAFEINVSVAVFSQLFSQEEGVEKVFRSADAVYNFTNLVVRFERTGLFANCFHGHPLRNAE